MQTPNHEAILKLRDQSPELSYSSEELNTRLISFDNDELEYDPSIERPTIYITDDAEIVIKNTAIKLSPTGIFIINALRLSQGYGQTADDMISIGFKGASISLKGEAYRLKKLLNETADEPLMESAREGYRGSNVYTLLPTVEVVDRRTDNPEEQKASFLYGCVHRNTDGSPTRLEHGSLSFANPLKREETTRLMLKDFHDAAAIDDVFARLFAGRIGTRGADKPIMYLEFLPALTKGEEAELLRRKENALELYLTERQLTELERASIIDGVEATYELFAHTLYIVGKLARQLCNDRLPYSDLYQEGAMQLMEAVLRQQYFNDGSQNFRHIAGWYIRNHRGRGMNQLHFQHKHAPVSIGRAFSKHWYAIREATESLRQEHGRVPTPEEISSQTGISLDRVFGVASMRMSEVRLDKPLIGEDGDAALERSLIDPDFSDRMLDQVEQKNAIDALFGNDSLSDLEKIMMSVRFHVFHPRLIGAQINRRGQTVFTYPQNENSFYEYVHGQRSLNHFSEVTLGFKGSYGSSILNRALRKSRRILAELTDFDSSPYSQDVDGNASEQQKIDAVLWAQEVSPHQRLGSKELRALSREVGTSYNETHIIELFGSLPAFHIACGFEPDKQQAAKRMQPNDIVHLALSIRPDQPLNTFEIKTLSKHGEFVSIQAIYSKFDSIPNFREICRKEIERRAQKP